MIFLCVVVEKGANRGTAASIEVVDCRERIEEERRACAAKLPEEGTVLAASIICECRSRPIRVTEAIFAVASAGVAMRDSFLSRCRTWTTR